MSNLNVSLQPTSGDAAAPLTASTATDPEVSTVKTIPTWGEWCGPWRGADVKSSVAVLIVGLILWFIVPGDLGGDVWHVFVVFLCTIICAIAEPIPISGVAFVSIAICVSTKILTINEALSGFMSSAVWLIVVAFFISKGMVVTGLGRRMCYTLLKVVGKGPIGVAYGVVACESILALAIPSCTARGAGILLPILTPVMVDAFKSDPKDGTEKRYGSYLCMVEVHANALTSTLWLTASAWNPVIQTQAEKLGVDLNWTSWAVSFFIPVGIQLILMPLVMFMIFPPEVKSLEKDSNGLTSVQRQAAEKLEAMGKLSFQEFMMICVFMILLLLWILGSLMGFMDATSAAIVGVSLLLIVGVLDVKKHIISDSGAFNTLLWFSVLVMLADQLSKKGFFDWLSGILSHIVPSQPFAALIVVTLIFYIAQYMFASNTAHVLALFEVCARLGVNAGLNPALTVRMLSMGCASGGLAPYTCATNPPYFEQKYVTMKEWFLVGLAMSVQYLVIMFTVGYGWELIVS